MLIKKNIFSYVQYGGKEKMAKVGKKSTYVFYTKKKICHLIFTHSKKTIWYKIVDLFSLFIFLAAFLP